MGRGPALGRVALLTIISLLLAGASAGLWPVRLEGRFLYRLTQVIILTLT